jgi:hypothetical protein
MVHVPHEGMVPPQPLGHGPQFTFEGQADAGVHAGWPHTDGFPPPPQVSPATVHVGHVHVPPQPSLTGPQKVPPVGFEHAVA